MFSNILHDHMEVEGNDWLENLVCELCHQGNNENVLMLCDGCDKAFHTYCINLNRVPSGTWYCAQCTYSNTKVQTPVYKGMRVHIYERVSTKLQDQPEYGRVGAKVQNKALLDFCAKNDMIIVSTVTEIGSAYKNGKTPKLDALINKVKKGEPILVYSVSRFSRNNANASKMLSKIHSKWSFVWSITEGVKSHETDFKTYVNGAENESNILSKRMINSNRRIVEAGGFNGRKKPFGYSVYRDENGIRRLKENALEQEVIKCIKQMSQCKKYNNFHNFHKIINKEFSKYNFTKLELKHIISDYYRKKCTILPTDSFVTDMIKGLED